MAILVIRKPEPNPRMVAKRFWSWRKKLRITAQDRTEPKLNSNPPVALKVHDRVDCEIMGCFTKAMGCCPPCHTCKQPWTWRERHEGEGVRRDTGWNPRVLWPAGHWLNPSGGQPWEGKRRVKVKKAHINRFLCYSLGHQRWVHDVHGKGIVGHQRGEGRVVVQDIVLGHWPHQAGERTVALLHRLLTTHIEEKMVSENKTTGDYVKYTDTAIEDQVTHTYNLAGSVEISPKLPVNDTKENFSAGMWGILNEINVFKDP